MNPLEEAVGYSSRLRANPLQGPAEQTAAEGQNFARMIRSVADGERGARIEDHRHDVASAPGNETAFQGPLLVYGTIAAAPPALQEEAPVAAAIRAGDAIGAQAAQMDTRRAVAPSFPSRDDAPLGAARQAVERLDSAAQISPLAAETGAEFAEGVKPAGESNVDLPAISSNPGMKISIDEIAVHFPAAISRSLSEIETPAESPYMARRFSLDPSRPRETLKILKFSLEPASLGAIAVRMKVTQSRVEIRMEAQSDVAPALMQAREALSAAIGDKGMSLDAYEVRAPIQAADALSASETPIEKDGNRQGEFSHDERPSRQDRQDGERRAMRPRDDPPSSHAPLGYIL